MIKNAIHNIWNIIINIVLVYGNILKKRIFKNENWIKKKQFWLLFKIKLTIYKTGSLIINIYCKLWSW